MAEVHARAIQGDIAHDAEVPHLVDTHLHVPYAYSSLREQLEAAATRVLRDYMNDNAELFDKIEFSEKSIELNLGGGVSVIGRIDLVRRIDTGEISIVDLKSSDRAQAEGRYRHATARVRARIWFKHFGTGPDGRRGGVSRRHFRQDGIREVGAREDDSACLCPVPADGPSCH